MRPARRLRDTVLPRLAGSCASIHLRLCSKLSWNEITCGSLADPERTARDVLRCASVSECRRTGDRLFISADSEEVVKSLAEQMPGRLLTFSDIAPAVHISKSKAIDAAAISRLLFDWAAYSFSPSRVLALPTTFVASAVCMFRPHLAFDIYPRPSANRSLDCGHPIGRDWSGGAAHACKVDAVHGAAFSRVRPSRGAQLRDLQGVRKRGSSTRPTTPRSPTRRHGSWWLAERFTKVHTDA